MELIVKFIFSEDWDNDCKNIDAELIAEDAIRELAEGVGYEIIDLKRGSENSSDENAALTLHGVSNWGEMKLACKYSKKHDKFTACLHKDTDPAMICSDPAHCPMIKKWSNCAFNRPDC